MAGKKMRKDQRLSLTQVANYGVEPKRLSKPYTNTDTHA